MRNSTQTTGWCAWTVISGLRLGKVTLPTAKKGTAPNHCFKLLAFPSDLLPSNQKPQQSCTLVNRLDSVNVLITVGIFLSTS